MNKYGKRLKELRELHHYSQEELAKLLNTSRSRIGMYEQGRRQPDFEMQEAIADLFNVSIDYLFKREEKSPNMSDDPKTSAFVELFQNAPQEYQDAAILLLKSAPPKS